MNYFEYVSPLHSELKKLGYCIPIEPSDADIFITKLLLSSHLCNLDMFVDMLEQYHIRDIAKAPIRVYAYYLNNPQQFNHNPKNVVGSMVRQLLNACMSILTNLYKININTITKARPKLIHTFEDRLLGTYLKSSKELAKRVEHNTLLVREGLNADERILDGLFR